MLSTELETSHRTTIDEIHKLESVKRALFVPIGAEVVDVVDTMRTLLI